MRRRSRRPDTISFVANCFPPRSSLLLPLYLFLPPPCAIFVSACYLKDGRPFHLLACRLLQIQQSSRRCMADGWLDKAPPFSPQSI